ncbi:RNA polymerase sigma factor [Phenylobacterium sp.]|uniref:RNA polymerase sigma factor n=1 Tax=Phenylobacterium sp. TaxID=1871053 RepID=UPI003563F80C
MGERIAAVYRQESRRVFASLVRLLGDLDLAEEALHDAFVAAARQWPRDGEPGNPRAWLVSAGRFKAIDRLRRRARLDAVVGELAVQPDTPDPSASEEETVADDQLRLIYVCCHPALSPDAQVALTLREVCGLTTEAIAAAFLTGAPTLAQRIVRAKARIRQARIPFEAPEPADLAARLATVLHVIYLVFNEGYSASSGEVLARPDLAAEAIRLGRLLCSLTPEPEAKGLLALLLLHDSRRAARTSAQGDLVLLDDQDRALWDRSQIAEGAALVTEALSSGPAGPYALQAAIAAVHADAADPAATDWAEIVGLYDALARVRPSAVVELNRAVAVAMRDGPQAGLVLVDAILSRGDLRDYHLAHAARADLCRRLGRKAQARASYERALSLARQAPERRYLQRRLDELAA